jgi:hypothetical protein
VLRRSERMVVKWAMATNWRAGVREIGVLESPMWEKLSAVGRDVAVFVVEVRGSAETQSSPFILDVERPPDTYPSVRVRRRERPGCGV